MTMMTSTIALIALSPFLLAFVARVIRG